MGAFNHVVRSCWMHAARVLLAIVALCSAARAGDFETGNDLYDQGKYAEAKQRYEALVAAGHAGANVFFNLGNADHRLGLPGRAILNYERAVALEPGHPEARANLNLLRQQAGAKLPSLSWAEKTSSSRSLTFWIVAASLTGWLFVFGVGFIATSSRAGKGGLWPVTLSGAAGLAFSGGAVWLEMKDQALAIITAKQTEARLAPAASSGVAEALPAGSRVRVLSERGPWVYCELPGLGRGWVAQEAVERVRPPRS